MNILLVYPKYPNTFWSWNNIMKIVNKKAAFPPLGLMTVAAMLPTSCQKKLVDMNVEELKDEDIKKADYVFISAMITQLESAKEVIARCKQLDVKIVAGGPLFTTGYEKFGEVDHFIVGEAEDIFPLFWDDIENRCAKRVYISDVRPNIAKAPIPLWELINPNDYVSLSVQNSRGCPFDCEFCDIVIMNGRIPRVKPVEQFLKEIDAIYEIGFCGMVLVVDDNFIGNRAEVKKMLSGLIQWQEKNNYPFTFSTEASINLADDKQLMDLMVLAGFNQVFLGLETPSSAGLAECGKVQNKNRNLIDAVKKIQNHGLHPLGGFIVGFDSDPEDIFQAQIDFIQKAGVVVAMVGLLQALPKTRLYERLLKEGRILGASSGNNTDCYTNFKSKMDPRVLLSGYKNLIKAIYSPKKYYERICIFLDEYNTHDKKSSRINWFSLKAFVRSIWYIGIIGPDKKYYWKTLFVVFLKYRKAFPEAVALLIYGLHLRKIADAIQEY